MTQHGLEVETRAVEAWWGHPYRLVSLREIMQTIKASGLIHAGNNLMLYGAPARLFSSPPSAFANHNPDGQVSYEERAPITQNLRTIQADCYGLNLTVSQPRVQRLIARLENFEPITYRQLDEDCHGLLITLGDELDSRLFLAIDSGRVRSYQQPSDGWYDSEYRFPSIRSDVDEASKCLALNRNTAVVFHLMRVMETGLRAVGKSLNDDSIDPQRNPTWERILGRCDDELKKPLAQRSAEWREDEQFFSGVAARMRGIKDAWRNPTMHPASTYTDEQADEIYGHVRGFMQHLASKLKEG